MRHYTHLTTDEREKAMVLREKGCGVSEIARQLGRDKSCISRELQRNAKADGSYSAAWAEKKYRRRRKKCHKPYIMANAQLAEYVAKRMRMKWTPEQIEGRARLEGYPIRFSYSSIYRAIDRKQLPQELKNGMRFKAKYKRRKSKDDDKRGKMQGITSIHDRPPEIESRQAIGHWESDTVLGRRKTGAIGTHVERKTGYLIAFKLDGTETEPFVDATVEAFQQLPAEKRISFTADRGKEFTNHAQLKKALDMPVYFCDPYSPWQRGTNENTNGLLRQFFPKKTSFLDFSSQDLACVNDLINHRPRKRLGWLSPHEAFFDLALGCCT